jgi:predicted RNA-binding Zn-ribbon protein involved in translation (DUF1610 family)
MSEKEKALECDSCGASYRILFEEDGVDFMSPDTCPFCGEAVNGYDDDEEWDDEWDDEDDDVLDS